MLTIIHGDDITKSRKYYTDLKSKNPEAVVLEGQDVTVTALTQILEGGELFTDNKTLFIEQFITKKKNTDNFKEVLKYLSNTLLSAEITIWEGKELEKSTVNVFKGSNIKLFKLAQALFSFLDSLKPGNSKQILQLFHQALLTTDEEAIFYMLIRHLRLLLAVHPQSVILNEVKNLSEKPETNLRSFANAQDDSNKEQNKTIEEVKRLQPWQKSKLEKQSSHFTLEQLIVIYQQLFDLESAYKTGDFPGSLSNSIDIFLLGI